MAKVETVKFTFERLTKHPLFRKYIKAGYDKEVLKHQINDPFLAEINFDEITEVKLTDFIRGLLKRGSEWEEQREQDQLSRFRERIFSGSQIDDDDSRITIIIDETFTEMKIILHKPQIWQKALTENEIWKILLKKGISAGVKKEYITRLAENPVYEKRFKIALGKKAEVGKDGEITFFFEKEFTPLPKENADGTVDFRELGYVQNVEKGTLLCEITPPETGADGMALNGKSIPGIKGQPVRIAAGKNTVISPDGQKIYATCEGRPIFQNDVVEVSQILNLEHVNYETGNIDFVGSVTVRGDVDPAFTVKATGDIIVQGIVDGALIAGRDIFLRNGVKGGGISRLESGGDIHAIFIENAKILCRGNLYADSLLSSEVVCWNDVKVHGKNGKIVGGRMKAGGRISADQLGNDFNTLTVLKLDDIDEKEDEEKRLKRYINHAEETIQKLEKLIQKDTITSGVSRQIFLIRIVYVVSYLEQQIRRWNEEAEEGKNKKSHYRRVTAAKVMHPNVLAEIEGMFYRNAVEKRDGVVIRISDGRMIRELSE